MVVYYHMSRKINPVLCGTCILRSGDGLTVGDIRNVAFRIQHTDLFRGFTGVNWDDYVGFDIRVTSIQEKNTATAPVLTTTAERNYHVTGFNQMIYYDSGQFSNYINLARFALNNTANGYSNYYNSVSSYTTVQFQHVYNINIILTGGVITADQFNTSGSNAYLPTAWTLNLDIELVPKYSTEPES